LTVAILGKIIKHVVVVILSVGIPSLLVGSHRNIYAVSEDLLSVTFLNSFAIGEEEVPEPDSQLTCSTGDSSLPNTK
jgi:hypothetical protein